MQQINLIFSMGFDSNVYTQNQTFFNRKFVGEKQLLLLLERELGLSGVFVSEDERRDHYHKYIELVSLERKTFISDSFELDSKGVSKELLAWRDYLKLSNWNFETGISERLDLLSHLEKAAVLHKGEVDRWLDVITALEKASAIGIATLRLEDKRSLLPPYLHCVFNELGRLGVTVKENLAHEAITSNSNLHQLKRALIAPSGQVVLDSNDTSFHILRFKDSVEASDFMAQQLSFGQQKPVLLNSIVSNLDTSFATFDIPLSGSDISNANPQLIQLFKLAGSLLFTTINPYNLQALLALPRLPFSKKLAVKLRKVLTQYAGIGNEKWEETIQTYLKSYSKDSKKFKKQQDTLSLYLTRNRVSEITSKDLKDFYTAIGSWAGQQLHLQNEVLNQLQFGHLQNLCSKLVQFLKACPDEKFSATKFEILVGHFYEPMRLQATEKQQYSPDVFDSGSQLYAASDHTVWFDFYNTKLQAKQGSFLYASELKALEKTETFQHWSSASQIDFQLSQLYKGFLKTNSHLCLIICDTHNGAPTTEHPLYTQLSAMVSNLKDFEFAYDTDKQRLQEFGWKAPKLAEISQMKLPTTSDSIAFTKTDLLAKRAVESYSSLENLVYNPLDWVLQYQAKISDTGLGDIPELMLLKGNLSHAVVQSLLELDKERSIDLKTASLSALVASKLEELAPQMALPFLLEENKIAFQTFSTQLQMSFAALVGIIHNNSLEFMEAESITEGHLNGTFIKGAIDLLFSKNGTPVVIDLKWTYSDKKYMTLLEEEKALQLAIYSKLLDNTTSITGYFLLSHGRLFTQNDALSGAGVVRIAKEGTPSEVNNRVVNRIGNSYAYRWEELQSGYIELSEKSLLEDIPYANATQDEDLVPLNEIDKKKKENPYSDYNLLKGNIR